MTPTIASIQTAVAQFYNIAPAEMTSPRRARQFSRPRQVAMYLARTMTSHSYPTIGVYFGGRDHSTVMHGVSAVKERLDTIDLDGIIALIRPMLSPRESGNLSQEICAPSKVIAFPEQLAGA